MLLPFHRLCASHGIHDSLCTIPGFQQYIMMSHYIFVSVFFLSAWTRSLSQILLLDPNPTLVGSGPVKFKFCLLFLGWIILGQVGLGWMGLGRVRFHVKQTACGQLNFYCVANFSWSPAYIYIGRVKLDIFVRRIGWPISKMELLVCTWSRSGKQIGWTQDQRHKATSSKLVMFTISIISKMKGKKGRKRIFW